MSLHSPFKCTKSLGEYEVKYEVNDTDYHKDGKRVVSLSYDYMI